MIRNALLGLGLCAMLSAGCVFTEDTQIGNIEKTCTAGQPCECDVLGNCDISCPAGGCDIECTGTGNCIIDCAESCHATCTGTGNCDLTCTGAGCSIDCQGLGNCLCNGSIGTCG